MLEAVNGSAKVVLQGRAVGELTFRAGGCGFRYTDDLLDPTHQVLGQVFEESPRQQFREPVGLPSWFANLLPERGSALRRYYAAQFGERELDDARLLLSLGGDLPGAATVEPVDVPAEGVLVATAVAGVDPGGVHLSALAGAQRKMSVVRDGERLTLPAAGESGDWIAKLPGPEFRGLAENEFLMMRWVATAGVAVPAVDLVPAAGVPPMFDTRLKPGDSVYLVRRFDRPEGVGRIHMEDLAQVTGQIPIHRDRGTYDGIGRLVHDLTGPEGFVDYLRRLVAMVLMGNDDAHLKNWTLWYPDGRTPRLSPAYDLVCTTVYTDLAPGLVLPFAGERRTERIGIDAFRSVALAAGFHADQAEQVVMDATDALIEAWPQIRQPELFPELVAHIDERLSRHPLSIHR